MSSFSVLKVNDLESINKKRFAIIINVFVLINSDYFSTKKEALRLLFFYGGTDEARTRDLLRDRQAL